MFTWFLRDVFDIHITSSACFLMLIALLLLSWFILLLSKLIFKKFFTNVWWENIFIIMVGFLTVMQVFYGSLYYLVYLKIGKTFVSYVDIYSYTFVGIDEDMLFPLFLFFIAYLTHFIIRLAYHMKKKSDFPTNSE